jgi:hypothetical protein
MSRSFKRTPGFCDRNPFFKNQANRRVRKDWGIPNGKAYRKVYDSWSICDYRFLFFTKEEVDEFSRDRPWRAWMK